MNKLPRKCIRKTVDLRRVWHWDVTRTLSITAWLLGAVFRSTQGFSSETSLTMEDFCRLRVETGSARQRRHRSILRNKGHHEMYNSFRR